MQRFLFCFLTNSMNSKRLKAINMEAGVKLEEAFWRGGNSGISKTNVALTGLSTETGTWRQVRGASCEGLKPSVFKKSWVGMHK